MGELTPRNLPAVLRRMRKDIDLIKRSLIRLGGGGGGGGTTVRTTTDWNTATQAGFWTGNGAANAPVTGVLVADVESDGTVVVQHVAKDDGTREYVRFSTNGGASWSDWKIAMGRHITENAGNGRAYFGTGTTATNQNGTYMGLSPVGGDDEDNDSAFWFQTSAMQVFAIRKDGRFVSPVMPTVMAAGTFTLSTDLSANEYSDTTVTFPSGRFTATPRMSAIGIGPNSVRGNYTPQTVTTTSSRIRVFNPTSGGIVASGTRVDWTAVQMTLTNGSG